MLLSGVRNAALPAVALLTVGCFLDGAGPERCRSPEIVDTEVAANELNALSAVVTTRVRFADSVAVEFVAVSESDTTPARRTGDDEFLTLPVLGLLPSQTYAVRVHAFGACAVLVEDAAPFTTAALPDDVPSYVTSGTDPSPGFVVFAAGAYGLAIDNTGRVAWYRRFPNGPGLNFQAQPNGRFVARPSPSSPSEAAEWVEIDVLGNVTRTVGCARGLQARVHDFLAQPDGSYWLMCDETRTFDLSATGGPQEARVTGTVIQHMGPERNVLFEWSVFDHFAIDFAAIALSDRSVSPINWTHGNAFDLDNYGQLFVSFRNLSEVTKIDTKSGSVIWRMGGAGNQFAFGDVIAMPFARQHGLRVGAEGQLLLLDNLGDPAESRAKRFQYDESARASELLASYGPSGPVVAQLGGTTQQLPGGRLLVSFGNAGRVEEYDAAGSVVWRIEGNAGYVFRAQRIRSLYEPGVGLPR